MKRTIISGVLMATILAWAGYAAAQEKAQPQCKAAAASSDAKPMSAGMMQRCMGMMQKAGVAPDVMRRWQAMMATPIFLDSPCAVYGQAQALGLSDAQRQKLVQIQTEARKKALAVLTSEQRKKLGAIPDKPMTMMQMGQQMRGKMMPMMQKMMGGKSMSSPMMTCPRMKSTQGGTSKRKGSGTK